MGPVLVFGTTGQLAREIAARAGDGLAGVPIVALGRAEADLTRAGAVAQAIGRYRPSLVVNAAAYTAVDRAEAEPEMAFAVNRDAPEAMARACAGIGAGLIHVSTDYVFDGKKVGAYVEDDEIAPLSVYGRSKAEGEAAVRSALDAHVILRTSWVVSPFGQNFVKTMLRLAATKEELSVVDDQRGSPTPAAALAEAILTVSEAIRAGDGHFGTFHFQGAPATSWAGLAEAVFSAARGRLSRSPKVRRIATAEYPTPAVRPLNSVLDCAKIREAYGIVQPDWRLALEGIVARLLSNDPAGSR